MRMEVKIAAEKGMLYHAAIAKPMPTQDVTISPRWIAGEARSATNGVKWLLGKILASQIFAKKSRSLGATQLVGRRRLILA